MKPVNGKADLDRRPRKPGAKRRGYRALRPFARLPAERP